MRPFRLAVAVMVAIAAPRLASAQVAPGIPAGSAIRVTAPEVLARRTTGEFHSVTSDTLWMGAGRRQRVAVPVHTVDRLEVSGGRPRLKWALVGGVSSAVVGMILGGRAGAKDDITGVGAGVGAAAGAAQGLVLGAIGGALLAPRRWINYPLSAIR